MDASTWPSVVETVFKQLSGAAVIFIRAAGSNEPCWSDTRGSLLTDEQTLVEPLRAIRLWAAQLPDLLSAERTDDSFVQLHLNSITQLTNFLDALLLVLYRDGQLSPQWSDLQSIERMHLLLCLSISLQCLLNTLSARKATGQSTPVGMLQALLSVLLTGSRSRFLLGHSPGHPLSSQHLAQCERIVSYASLLFYSVLLHFECVPVGLDPVALELIGDKLISELQVFSAILFCAVQPTDHASAGHCQLHCRLLLCKLAEVSANHPWTTRVSSDNRDNEDRLVSTVHATGIVLILRSLGLDGHDSVVDGVGCDEAKSARTPRTVRPCLAFAHHYLAKYGQPDVVVNLLVCMLQREYSRWSTELLRLMNTNPCGSDVLQSNSASESSLPFAWLRGAQHLLSEFVFSDDQSQCGHGFKDEKLARRLWDCVCDLIVVLSVASSWLDRLFPSRDEPIQRRSVNGSSCTVYPSRMTKKWPTLPSESPLFICQAVGMQNDCLRCLAGLISKFPQFSLSLASHSMPSPFVDIASQLQLTEDKTAFQCILSATNRDPINPFASEWAILIIKLAVKPESRHSEALEGARILSDRLTNLELIRE